jgi:N-acetyl-D-muramate 6-phosphate phosphatase
MTIRAVLFDLDGTLADTAPDLGLALNRQRKKRGLTALPIEQIRPHASAGARGLLKIGFELDPGHPEYDSMRTEFLGLYAEHICRDTRLFDGVLEMLSGLEERHLRWGVVTNKPARFTLPLLELLGLASRAACVVSGDTTPYPKPHPAPLLAASEKLGLTPAECLYLGDDRRDVEASLAAGMPCFIAAYGYLGSGGDPLTWGASRLVQRPLDLLQLLPA